ncbi:MULTISPECIES: hypothetical protein [unclassified Snodgrassella]|nr:MULTISPECIES: hypothetical protein [unclassified Snodgrassella]MBI0067410.1 hypothetical protein [Snodgrassella sp. M0110]MBI0076625.1 hypothetical protein [Snodgrassella sp. M0118]MBI0078711.1 hypothetical protein [Snodgrassella sp. M0112]
MDYQPQDLEMMENWRCASKKYTSDALRGTILVSVYCFIMVLILFFSFNNNWKFFFITIFLLIVIYQINEYIKIIARNLIKQVHFTPEAIYIENEKIDISNLKSITFVQHIIKDSSFASIENYPDFVESFEFSMIIDENSDITEDIHFYLQFSDGIADNIADYDYQNNFISILNFFAKERRKSLNNSDTSI